MKFTVLVIATFSALSVSFSSAVAHASKPWNCKSRTQSFIVGSVNEDGFRSFNGTGINIFSQTNTTLTKVLNFPPSITGDNPTYIDIYKSSIYSATSVWPSSTATKISLSSRPPYVRAIKAPSPENTISSHISVSKHGVAFIADTFGGAVMSFDTRSMKLLDVYDIPVALATNAVPERQGQPGPHMMYLIADERKIVVPDLGADRVFIFGYGINKGRPNFGKFRLLQSIKLNNGDGPRHVVQHKPSLNLFVVNELSQSITTLCYTPGKPFKRCQKFNLLKGGPVKNGNAAAIRISRMNTYLYASVRKDTDENPVNGAIVGFKVSKEGRIERKIGEWSSGGVHPRDFNIAYDLRVNGKCQNYIAVANRDSDNVVFFRLTKNGMLGMSDFEIDIGAPTSVLQM